MDMHSLDIYDQSQTWNRTASHKNSNLCVNIITNFNITLTGQSIIFSHLLIITTGQGTTRLTFRTSANDLTWAGSCECRHLCIAIKRETWNEILTCSGYSRLLFSPESDTNIIFRRAPVQIVYLFEYAYMLMLPRPCTNSQSWKTIFQLSILRTNLDARTHTH